MNKKSQGLSINAIILVAIGLIVLVVLIAVFSGAMARFVQGLFGATTCEKACKSVDRAVYTDQTKDQCKTLEASERALLIEGEFDDVDIGEVCCCKENAP